MDEDVISFQIVTPTPFRTAIDVGTVNFASITWDKRCPDPYTTPIRWKREQLVYPKASTQETLESVMKWCQEQDEDKDFWYVRWRTHDMVIIETQMKSKMKAIQNGLYCWFRTAHPHIKVVLVSPVAIKNRFGLSMGSHAANKKIAVDRMLEKLTPEVETFLKGETKLDDLADVWWIRMYFMSK